MKDTKEVLTKRQGEAGNFELASEWQLIKWKFLRHKLAVVSLIFLGIMYLLLIFAEFFTPHDPSEYVANLVLAPPQTIRFVDQETGRFQLRPFVYPLDKSFHPDTFREIFVEDRSQKHELGLFVRSSDYLMWGFIRSDLHLFGIRDNPEAKLTLLGRDSLGRDQASRLIFGARISLTIGFAGMIIGFFPSVFLGGVSGLFGGAIDKLLMRVNETVGAIPTLPLWIALTAALPTKIPIVLTYFYLTLIMAGVSLISGGSRTIRGKFMAIKTEEFIMAAKLDNARTPRLIFRYMLPSFMSHIIADLTLSIPGMILGETGLSFIGLGLQEPAISWGVMLQECRSITNLRYAPWLFSSAVLVLITILAFNFVGDGLRDAVDPYATI